MWVKINEMIRNTQHRIGKPLKGFGVYFHYVNGECIRTERVSQWSQYKTVDISLLSEGVYFCRMRWVDGEGSCKVVRLE